MSFITDTIAGSRRTRAPRVAVLGATLGTGNMGVDALGAATVQELVALDQGVEILYQSWVNEPIEIGFGGQSHRCEPLVIRRRPNLLRQNSVEQLRRVARLQKRFGPVSSQMAAFLPAWRRLRSCDLVLDISAGDSFADTYGERIFWYQSQIKLMCLDAGVPLVLLPQTIGPFNLESSRRTAADILRRALLVATREAAGVDEILQLCGPHSPPHVVESPDVAFVLEPSATPLPARAEAQVEGKVGPLIAVNVSGLLFAKGDQFDLVTDYPDLMVRLLRWALSQPQSRVLLVPHVVPTGGGAKGSPTQDTTDNSACEALLRRLEPHEVERIDILAGADDPAKAKYAMAESDFFVGARMHAFIGAVSLATPGALLAYSKKAAGTAGMAGFADTVVDLRSLAADGVIAAVDRLYVNRSSLRERLLRDVAGLKRRVRRFFQEELSPLISSTVSENERSPPKKSVL
ncbi:colanic acid biosynthesis protein [Botrimarina colliarenosi]|uniref:Colanic acid biosynthesis protein n=1 Tax=Botrimarina colliarenosi TaxID=2528001 RepID=A0A5C6ADB6_9BACT|nr:polysaccharide pyruvyl transferase family protein [Botrimarina colliarenosi]TWT97599.1 colanic acid biosynthesis protein [Botrimarina colliarenosi]